MTTGTPGVVAPGVAAPVFVAPVFVAIDTPDAAAAARLAAAVAPHVAGIKLGLEFFVANGPDAVRRVAQGVPLFLDLKLHDIPNTVAGAVRSALAVGARYLTLHASGGPAMLRAAADAARAAPRPPKLLAVTVLTSLAEDDLARIGQIGPARAQVERLALMARAAGCDGAVCSPHETAALRAACGAGFDLVVPGIRPAGSNGGDDQKRVMAPDQAIAAGASYLVIGRPITGAPDPAAAARAIAESLAPGRATP